MRNVTFIFFITEFFDRIHFKKGKHIILLVQRMAIELFVGKNEDQSKLA